LLPNDLNGINYCFSPGVSSISNFELSLANSGIKCFLADYSVDAPQTEHFNFDFEKKYLGPINKDEFLTLESWVNSKVSENDSDFLLQMDIEGAEYNVILSTSSKLLSRFRIIIVEFHNLDSLLDKFGHSFISSTLDKLLIDFDLVHIHPNNTSYIAKHDKYIIPSIMEFTFIRKDRMKFSESSSLVFPHPLDMPNDRSKSDLHLPECWGGRE
jgi:hypothetical protein